MSSKRSRRAPRVDLAPRASPAPWRQWGADLDPKAVAQMRDACSLDVAVRGALMPDAHVGYGLPIGGVLATCGAVIPYALGVDIACRMKLSVLDLPVATLDQEAGRERLQRAIAQETRFGVGATFKARRQHPVMEAGWEATRITRELKDRAWAQLGTQRGSGGSGDRDRSTGCNHRVHSVSVPRLLADMSLLVPRFRDPTPLCFSRCFASRRACCWA